jgi:hypothetical protein
MSASSRLVVSLQNSDSGLQRAFEQLVTPCHNFAVVVGLPSEVLRNEGLIDRPGERACVPEQRDEAATEMDKAFADARKAQREKEAKETTKSQAIPSPGPGAATGAATPTVELIDRTTNQCYALRL